MNDMLENRFNTPVVLKNIIDNECTERIYRQVIEKINLDSNGYLFENYIYKLGSVEFKYLYNRMCTKSVLKHKNQVSIVDIFNAFEALNIGYKGRKWREESIYSTIYQVVETDVRENKGGHFLHRYLLRLSENEFTDLLNKIYPIYNGEWIRNWVGDLRYQEEIIEFLDFRRDNPHIMMNYQFYIHCHFSVLNMGYDFRVREFYSRSNVPLQEQIMIESNKDKTKLQVKLKIDGIIKYCKKINIDYIPIITNEVRDCVVCLESIGIPDVVTLNCNHEFCGKCVARVCKGAIMRKCEIPCPYCRTYITGFIIRENMVLVKMIKTIVS